MGGTVKAIFKKIILTSLSTALIAIFAPKAQAETYMGVNFPYGPISFADEVVSYTPGAHVAAPYNNPARALGIPDMGPNSSYQSFWDSFVSLGDGGTLVVKFTDNFVTPNGDNSLDLWVFEVGKLHEQFGAYLSKNGNDWIFIGDTLSRNQTGFNIDGIPGIEYRQKYYFVKLVDRFCGLSNKYIYGGADIDAVGAVSAGMPAPAPEPTSILLLGFGLVGMIGLGKKKTS